ncbi:hypothetical protein [Daejeonella oryzae]|uniref:hypothetical protein n=1 Tax=Daejeonella oryzae TaxID=1122943 RepID=UPI0004227ECC|nr:hypothetical protein [Daejeonella oryzae]
MKHLLIYSAIASMLIIGACNSDNSANAKTDSLEAAAAADSMLQEVLTSDSLQKDTVKAADTTSSAAPESFN